MKSDGLLQMVGPGLRESGGDPRPGCPESVSPHLVLLPRSVANIDESAPIMAEPASLHDDFDVARGIVLGVALGTSLWIVIGAAVWWFVR